MNTTKELQLLEENIQRRILEKGEKDVNLTKKMLEKLGVTDIPSL